jgi:hypothetical protein
MKRDPGNLITAPDATAAWPLLQILVADGTEMITRRARMPHNCGVPCRKCNSRSLA